MEHFFSKLAVSVGYHVLARRAGVSYQAVSRFAADPKPNQKRQRRQIIDAAIEEAEARLPELRAKIAETETTLQQLQTWKEEFK